MTAPNSEKGARYVGLLDQALCNGNWSEVPELARKTDKHTTGRACLTTAARAEAQVATSALFKSASQSVTTGEAATSLSESASRLKAAINVEKELTEDVYIARVCLAEIYWLQEDGHAALEVLPNSVAGFEEAKAGTSALGWLEVCAVKRTLIQAAVAERHDKKSQARELYIGATRSTPGTRSAELRQWTERLLARACLYTRVTNSSPTLTTLNESLGCFGAWSKFWQRAPSGTSKIHLLKGDVSRRRVWSDYYALLSMILQYGLLYVPESSRAHRSYVSRIQDAAETKLSSYKLRQRSIFQTAQETYESLLLNETQFPKANQTNVEVEDWVEQVMRNWRVFLGDQWTDIELGEGGREALSRDVLNILYRASTKTFHSTSILRHLFTVHATLGEFDLAMHAFESFLELVNKAKARAEKSEQHTISPDENEQALLTAVEAIRVLCRYGDYEQAEKAVVVGKQIQDWLGQDLTLSQEPEQNGTPNGVDGSHQDANITSYSSLRPKTLAAANRAVGVAKAHWARWTRDSASRTSLRAEALRFLQQAELSESHCPETVYATALVLSECGDVLGAMKSLKQTITSSELAENDSSDIDADVRKARSLSPLWHLFALCVSAKDDYAQAIKMCEAAFEQFGDPSTLLGTGTNPGSTDVEKQGLHHARGVVDSMEDFEKEGLLQIKLTQLALVELLEGPDAALEMSHSLLGMYNRLFGGIDFVKVATVRPRTAATSATTKTSTLRSLAGSIRPRSVRHSVDKDTIRPVSKASSGPQSPESLGNPIAITVTNEEGQPADRHHHHRPLPFKLRGTAGDWRQMNSFKTKHTDELGQEGINNHEHQLISTPAADQSIAAKTAGLVRPARDNVNVSQGTPSDLPSSSEQALNKISHNAPHDTWPPPAGHDDQPLSQDVRLPAPHPALSLTPEPRLPSAKDKQHKVSILINVWLSLAATYIRAELLDDGAAAIQEAEKLVDNLETEVNIEHAQAKRLFEKGWGGGKSVDELWADVITAVSIARFRASQ